MRATGADVLPSDLLRLVRGAEDDIAFVMATERLPGNEHLVGRWNESQHRTALSDGRHAYFIAYLGAQPCGFAIVRDWATAERVAHIKRVIVCEPERGHGRSMLSALVAIIFAETNVHRIWLGLFPDNDRARRAYEAVGFKAEGIARGSAFFGGVHRDELIMALLRSEWSGPLKQI